MCVARAVLLYSPVCGDCIHVVRHCCPVTAPQQQTLAAIQSLTEQVAKLAGLVVSGQSQAPSAANHLLQLWGQRAYCPSLPQEEGEKRQATVEVSPTAVPERGDSLLEKTIGQCPVTELEVLGVRFSALVDTGSQVSTITESYYKRHLQPRGRDLYNQDLHLHLTAANGLEIPYSGYLLADVTIAGQVVKDRVFLIIRDPPGGSRQHCLLGMNILGEMADWMGTEDGQRQLEMETLPKKTTSGGRVG